MKYLILLLTLSIMTLSVYGGQAELFTYNKARISEELSQLDDLETYVNTYPGITLQQIKSRVNTGFEDLFLIDEEGMPATDQENNPVLGIPSFLWGCVFGVTGIIIVYLITEDKVETGKAAKGFFISAITSTVLTVAIYAIIIIAAESYTFYYY